ncbi:PXMP2/4 family protein 4-like [Populus alba x Populus x berolinensis]|uniref:PXMP2/4 family protein 4-like n=1 Tax=Populus alba x Populus x berolinensis TaxID=444605 RepID=A0AAD6RQR6_9ROSI|nr:PXMP2/4 family protein 4-like [Populus alba x Populus x berolinensis]
MSGSFMRNSTIPRLLRAHTITNITDPAAHSVFRQQQQSRKAFFGFSNVFKRSKEYNNELSPSSFLTSSFSSKAENAAFFKIGFIGWYLGMVKSRPILTKSATSSLIYIAADLSSQTISLPSSEPYDLVRTLRMAGYGLLIVGPSLHFWFKFVSKLLPKRDLITTFKKILMGQTIYGPIMTVVFFSLNARLQGKHRADPVLSNWSINKNVFHFDLHDGQVCENSAEIIARLKRDLLPTMINGVMYWPVCDFVTFKFIPVHLQPLVSNSFSYLWTVYMTYMANLEKAGSSG